MKQASVSMEYIQETLEFGNKEILRSWEEGWLESRFRLLLWWGGFDETSNRRRGLDLV